MLKITKYTPGQYTPPGNQNSGSPALFNNVWRLCEELYHMFCLCTYYRDVGTYVGSLFIAGCIMRSYRTILLSPAELSLVMVMCLWSPHMTTTSVKVRTKDTNRVSWLTDDFKFTSSPWVKELEVPRREHLRNFYNNRNNKQTNSLIKLDVMI